MFRSARRAIVFPQSEHARLSAVIASGWDVDRYPIASVSRDVLALGVGEHDRGYGMMDSDAIGEVIEGRWLAIQLDGFAPRDDPVVDVIVAMHVRRLVSWSRSTAAAAALREMDRRLPALWAAAGLSHKQAVTIDHVTHLCDMVAFDFCLEEPASGTVVVTRADGVDQLIAYAVDGEGAFSITPWPLDVPELGGEITAYRSEGYPDRAQPVSVAYAGRPDSAVSPRGQGGVEGAGEQDPPDDHRGD